ncbi:MAG: hypothetical protein KGR98_05670, partial [Verrucomicrobia bacterium]|nr:hypothetical protein [Verrucomicrobiota bacterium]
GIVFVTRRQQAPVAPAAALSETEPAASAAPIAAEQPVSQTNSPPFQWSRLGAGRDYGGYIAKLRAIGCPEATIEDIVRGDVRRAFSRKRRRLGLDGSGEGRWSRAREMELAANLLGEPAAAASAAPAGTGTAMSANDAPQASQNSAPSETSAAPASQPVVLQNYWRSLGLNAEQQAAVAWVHQHVQNEMARLNQAPGDSANPNSAALPDAAQSPGPNASPSASNPNAPPDPNLGAQARAAYEQQLYYQWYEPQVQAAAASGQPLVINPDAFSP